MSDKIYLYVSHYETTEKLKNEEIMQCLNNNIKNSEIDKIYLLNETPKIIDDPKVVNIEIFQRPTFELFFNIVNRKTPIGINVIANSDIYFDETIKLIKLMPVSECYALTRYEDGELISSDCSQDVWIFRDKIKKFNCNFLLGQQACDNKIAWEIKNSGYFIDNPSLTIKSHHLHTSSRDWSLSGETIPRPHLYIKPNIQYVRNDNSYEV